jgi:exo-beta-1,3-glucanase (GH17 family)
MKRTFLFIIGIVLTLSMMGQSSPQIVITAIPPLGTAGNAVGKVNWDNLDPALHAVICIVTAYWEGGSGDYVKPFGNNFLNSIGSDGSFSVQLIDSDPDETRFYVVLKSDFAGKDFTNGINRFTDMAGKYFGSEQLVKRSEFVQPVTLDAPVPTPRPGILAANSTVSLTSSVSGATIYYTTDGSDPTSSSTVYSTPLTMPASDLLWIKAFAMKDGASGPVASIVYLPDEASTKPLWGLNLSMALSNEQFGTSITETEAQRRMAAVVDKTQWVRTFGTLNNGLPYVNKYMKQSSNSLRTLIGVYISTDAGSNTAQINGLATIIDNSPAKPDLIAVGNEWQNLEVPETVISQAIDDVRALLASKNVRIPVGTVEVFGRTLSASLLNKLDFVGFNSYPGVFNTTATNDMIGELATNYNTAAAANPSLLVLFTESGAPHDGGAYKIPYIGGAQTQTANSEKAAAYLSDFIDYQHSNNLPWFWFSAFDENCKSDGYIAGDNDKDYLKIEKYFGLMNADLEVNECFASLINPEPPLPIRYVRQDATGDGSSWSDASGDLQAMINASTSGNEVRVAAGTYTPNRRADNLSTVSPSDRNNAFVIKDGIAVLGGYPAGGGDQRNPAVNLTVLNGQFGLTNSAPNRVNHVVVLADVGSNTVLDGFTVTGGYSAGGSSITVNSKTISQSKGAGICNVYSNAVFKNMIIKENSSIDGGAAMMNDHSSPQIVNSLITANSSDYYAAVLYNKDSSPTLTNVTIAGNIGKANVDLMYNNDNLSIVNSVIWGNSNSNLSAGNSATITCQNSLIEGLAPTDESNLDGTDPNVNPLFVDATASDFRLKSGSPCIGAGANIANLPETDLAGKTIVGLRDIGAYECSDFVVAANESVAASAYLPNEYTSFTIYSNDNGTGQLTDIGPAGLMLGSHRLYFRKQFTPAQWYPLGFPFEIDSVTTNYQGQREELIPYTDANGTGNFFLKTYNGETNTFNHVESPSTTAIEANTGYIVQFPEYAGESTVEITFVSAPNPVLKNTNEITAPGANQYALIPNPSVENVATFASTPAISALYQFGYNNEGAYDGSNHFGLVGSYESPATTLDRPLRPYEAIVAVFGSVTKLRSSIGTGMDEAIRLPEGDLVIRKRYFTLTGAENACPPRNTAYIEQTVFASGRTEAKIKFTRD